MCSCEESGNVLREYKISVLISVAKLNWSVLISTANNVPPLYTGFLQYHKAKWFATSEWSRVFGILYQDSTLVWWYETQMASRPEGIICLKLAPELITTGQYSRRLFQVPALPRSLSGTGLENMIAVGERHRRQRVHFFLAESQQDFNAWWTAIVSTLPVAAAPLATMAQPSQPIIQGPSGSNYQPNVPVVQYVTNQQQPISSSINTTVVVRDSGPSYAGDAVVGMAAGAFMGAALSNAAHTHTGWSYGGYYNQDNDITVVNNYNLDYYNVEQGGGGCVLNNITDTDWSYDDF
ncbi:uncharacterized protein LOC124311297 isoform X3 [Daphnia pulicaria]|uniref:uncharacterized protein LOC124311297 isoform X3 n=1 Tax=Daphnia pulicaria TaxID=35523 RepID=UPI001EE9B03F|nr:uncharacterized protein LOC124311297 isoform X3 [Daphnia pulicaria]